MPKIRNLRYQNRNNKKNKSQNGFQVKEDQSHHQNNREANFQIIMANGTSIPKILTKACLNKNICCKKRKLISKRDMRKLRIKNLHNI